MASNKYTRLVSNTLLFGISTFSSKVLSFLLTRLYTGVLTESSFGIVDLVTACANLLIPLVSLGISNAVIRFGLEKGVDKKGVFTGGLVAIGSGFAILLLCWPLLRQVSLLDGHLLLLYVYVLTSCLRTLCCQFVRSRMYTRLYALDGILSTIYTIGFNVLFLVKLEMGTAGFLLAIIAADLLSTIGLFLVAHLREYVSFKHFDKTLYKNMLVYALPLVPASMFWWVTNSSDRFFIAYMVGTAANGLYAAAYKVPSIVSIFSTIFTEAWQLSAVTDGQDGDRDRFFTQIFQAVMGVAFVVGSALVLLCQFIMRYLVAPDYFVAWRFIPYLVLGTVFATLVGFLNSVYMVHKKSNMALATMLVGAVANLVLNWVLIKAMGANGAGFATFLSYALVFVIRALNTRSLVKIQFNGVKIIINTLLLLTQSVIMIAELEYWRIIGFLVLLLLVLVNGLSLYKGVGSLLKSRKK